MPTIRLNIHVDTLATVLASFNRIQVWRAPEELGQYTEITAPAAAPAFIDGSVVEPWNLQSESLVVTVNGVLPPNSFTFVGNNPLDLAHVIDQINNLVPGLASEVPTDTGRLRLSSTGTGTGTSILAQGSAVGFLGLPTTKANGKSARIVLVNPTVDYEFLDLDGLGTYWYKTRYFNSVSNTFSAFSAPRRGEPQLVIPDAQLVKAKLNLADAAGRPVVDRRVIFVPVDPRLVPTTVYGVLPGFDRIIAITDSQGNAEIKLVIGTTMKVFIEGSNFQRTFTVPNTDFDVLTVATAQPDPLSIVQAPPMPIRTS